MHASRFFLAAVAVLSMGLVACGGAAEEADNVASEQSALGEMGCTTAGGNPYGDIIRRGRTTTPTACGTTEHFYSSTSSYDNGPTCADQYIAEVTNIQGRALSVNPVWRSDAQLLPLDNCGGGVIEVGTYMRNASTGQWDVHTTTMRGFNFFGLGCVMFPEAGQTLPSLNGTEGYDTIRVAIQAKYTTAPSSMARITYKVPVAVDIVYPPVPC